MPNIIFDDAPEQEWRPRHFYIFENKTSGKLYVGQTVKPLESYYGSGIYWKAHNKKHGGHNRENIAIIWSKWFTERNDAVSFLELFESEFPDYWLSDEWANLVAENADSIFYHSHYPEVVKKLSEAQKKRWTNNEREKKRYSEIFSEKWKNDPDFREKCSGLKKLRESEDNSERLSEITTALWQTEEYREKVSKGHENFWNSEEGEKRKIEFSEEMRELWQDDEFHAMMKEKRLAFLNSEEGEKHLEFMSEVMKDVWKSEEYREKRKASVDDYWSKEKNKEAAAEKSKEMWKSDEYREKWKASVDDYWTNEENKEAAAKRTEKRWKDHPHLKDQVSEKMKSHWNDPEKRKEMLANRNPAKGENHYRFKGYFHTPFGRFTSTRDQDVLNEDCVRRWCYRGSKNEKVNSQSYHASEWLQNNYKKEDVVGKYYKEIGFWFEEKNSDESCNSSA